jgi:hypothetical protein
MRVIAPARILYRLNFLPVLPGFPQEIPVAGFEVSLVRLAVSKVIVFIRQYSLFLFIFNDTKI